METMKAMRIHTYGGLEVLKYEEAPRPKPEAGEVLIRVHEGYLKVRRPKGIPEEIHR